MSRDALGTSNALRLIILRCAVAEQKEMTIPRELMLHIERKLLEALSDTGFGSFSIEYKVFKSGKFQIVVGGTRSRQFYLSSESVAERLTEIG
jgi:hypothetical protein